MSKLKATWRRLLFIFSTIAIGVTTFFLFIMCAIPVVFIVEWLVVNLLDVILWACALYAMYFVGMLVRGTYLAFTKNDYSYFFETDRKDGAK